MARFYRDSQHLPAHCVSHCIFEKSGDFLNDHAHFQPHCVSHCVPRESGTRRRRVPAILHPDALAQPVRALRRRFALPPSE